MAMQQPDFNKRGGLVTVVTQDADSGEVLMVAYMNPEAWEKTLATRRAHYWSTSRNELWLKGGTSGNVQDVKEIRVDCDADALVIKVKQNVAACHTGYRSCFFRKVDGTSLKTDGKKAFDEKEVYKK